MARAQGARAQMALGFESVYGTPPAANSFWRMPFVSSTLGSQQPLLESDVLGTGRDPGDPMLDAKSADGDVVVPFDRDMMNIWLKLLFGEPVPLGPGIFFYGSGNTIPSASIEIGLPEVPHYAMITGVKANTLALNFQRTGLMTATFGLIAQDEIPANSSQAGTLENVASQRLPAWLGQVEDQFTVLGNVVSATLNYSNNLDVIDTIRGADTIEGADPSRSACTGQLVMRFASQALYDKAVAGTPVNLGFRFLNDDGDLCYISLPRVFLSKPRVPIEGPGGIQVTFDWQAASAGSPMLTWLLHAPNLTSLDNPT